MKLLQQYNGEAVIDYSCHVHHETSSLLCKGSNSNNDNIHPHPSTPKYPSLPEQECQQQNHYYDSTLLCYDDCSSSKSTSSSSESTTDQHSTHQQNDQEEEEEKDEIYYWNLLVTYPNFTLYLISYLAAHLGEWFTYVAQINAIERLTTSSVDAVGVESSSNNICISILIAIRFIPNILISSTVGGVLADSIDRRKGMIYCDLIGSIVSLLYIPIIEQYQSLSLVYLVAFIQSTVASIYDPLRQSIVPLLFSEKSEYLEKATILTGVAWSLVAAIGSSLGGFTASIFGIHACFVTDSTTYLLSAYLMWTVSGDYNVSSSKFSSNKKTSKQVDNHDENVILVSAPSTSSASPLQTFFEASKEGLHYILSWSFGPCLLFKATGALMFGVTDILNVQLSNNQSDCLGILFAFLGIGNAIGPLVADRFVSVTQPKSLFVACFIGHIIVACAFALIGMCPTFVGACIGTFIRGFGSCILWVNSTLILQEFADPNMLGRILGIDYGLCTLVTSLSSFVAARYMDQSSPSPTAVKHLAFGTFAIGSLTSLIWMIYFYFGSRNLDILHLDTCQRTTKYDGSEDENTFLLRSSRTSTGRKDKGRSLVCKNKMLEFIK